MHSPSGRSAPIRGAGAHLRGRPSLALALGVAERHLTHSNTSSLPLPRRLKGRWAFVQSCSAFSRQQQDRADADAGANNALSYSRSGEASRQRVQVEAKTAQQRRDPPEDLRKSSKRLDDLPLVWWGHCRQQGTPCLQTPPPSDLAGISAREPAAAGNLGSMEHSEAERQPAKRFEA